MKNNAGIARWFLRTWNFFVRPQLEWKTVNPSNNDYKGLSNYYFIPMVILSSIPFVITEIVILGFSKGLARWVLHIFAMIIGAKIARRLTFNKINPLTAYHGIAMQISIYSSTVFSVFYGISVTFENGFFSDAAFLCSLFAARTVYTGIRQYISSSKSALNLSIIPAACVILCPLLLSRLLKIIFHIPNINI